MANKLLNFRCPSELLGAIDKIGAVYYPADNDSGCDRSKTLIDILVAGVEALTNGEVVLPPPTAVKQDVRQSPLPDIKAMVEALVEEKLAQFPVQNVVQKSIEIPPNIPTQSQLHELKERINDVRISLKKEIQGHNSDLALLAGQIAELTERLDNMPASGISREELEAARDKVLQNWRVAKGAEKPKRIELALNKSIDIVFPQEPTSLPQLEPQADLIVVEETDIKEKLPLSSSQEWEQVCIDNIDEIKCCWHEK